MQEEFYQPSTIATTGFFSEQSSIFNPQARTDIFQNNNHGVNLLSNQTWNLPTQQYVANMTSNSKKMDIEHGQQHILDEDQYDQDYIPNQEQESSSNSDTNSQGAYSDEAKDGHYDPEQNLQQYLKVRDTL